MSESPSPITPEVVGQHSLSEDEYAKVLEILGRDRSGSKGPWG